MSIKILGGIAKGTILYLPDEKLARPTLVLLKRKIFDAVQKFNDRIFIDACAGSGAIGLEAWSRGAKKIYLIESEKKVFDCLLKNFEKFKNHFTQEILTRKIETFRMPFEKFLSKFKVEYLSFSKEQQETCIIFFDPPYDFHDLYKKVILEDLRKDNWYCGHVWIESDEKKGVPLSFWQKQQIEITRNYTHGQSYIIMAKF